MNLFHSTAVEIPMRIQDLVRAWIHTMMYRDICQVEGRLRAAYHTRRATEEVFKAREGGGLLSGRAVSKGSLRCLKVRIHNSVWRCEFTHSNPCRTWIQLLAHTRQNSHCAQPTAASRQPNHGRCGLGWTYHLPLLFRHIFALRAWLFDL